MTTFRPPLFCLVLLAAALVAGCDMPQRAKTPQGTPTAIFDTVAAVSQENADLGGSVVMQAMPTQELEPTADATKAQMAADLVALKDRVDAAEKAQNDQAERISQNYKDAAASNDHNAIIDATKVATQGEIAVSLAEQTTLQKQADNEKIIAQAQADEAAAALANANSNIVRTLAILAAVVSMVLLAVRALARHPLPVPVVHGENVTRPMVPTGDGPNSYHARELPVSPELMYRFMLYATQGKPLGTNNMEAAGILKSTERNERTKIITYLDILKHLAHDTGLVLTDAAIAYWRDWMEKYSPTLAPDVAETAAYTRHDYVNHGHDVAENAEGEGVSDHFTPLPDGQFLPGDTIYNAGIDPKKDETE